MIKMLMVFAMVTVRMSLGHPSSRHVVFRIPLSRRFLEQKEDKTIKNKKNHVVKYFVKNMKHNILIILKDIGRKVY